MTVGNGKVRYSLCCVCNLSVTGGYRGDGNTGVADSRVLLSPIRSPTQTTSLSPICGDLSDPARTTPEGVTLRNKMTIPKNGQRLETSTSCFYQPQRRSVILDGRSGRQIE